MTVPAGLVNTRSSFGTMPKAAHHFRQFDLVPKLLNPSRRGRTCWPARVPPQSLAAGMVIQKVDASAGVENWDTPCPTLEHNGDERVRSWRTPSSRTV